MRIIRSIIILRSEGMKFKELEKILLNDGWTFKGAKGSHYQYIHPDKKRENNNTEAWRRP